MEVYSSRRFSKNLINFYLEYLGLLIEQSMIKYFLLLLISNSVFGMDCSLTIKIQYRENNQIKNIVQKMCVLNDGEAFISSSCLKHCFAISANETRKLSNVEGQGSPDHLDCRRFAGSPMISTLTYKKRKIRTTLCVFKDESIGTLDLIRAWREKK